MRTKLPEVSERAQKRIAEVHSALLVRGFRRLSQGPFGLPSYDHVECWILNSIIIYVVWRADNGDYDILSPVCGTNRIDETWKAVDALAGSPAAVVNATRQSHKAE